ncbi:chaperonin 10-like protein [Paraphoma chrysanthemicola]|uniref:Chaperonin 10-like protein n=1 Tax=Paraphoma chrysanthemicola TaxID=798071 RepID=A0A8K0QX58_9PLEO|nr:chaperonin 10-like protein [Paraphoma chrysanthemicola]
MAEYQNKAAWLPGEGKQVEVGPADMPEPGPGELLVEVKVVAAQPSEYKIQEGLLPYKLSFPTIIGISFSGVVVKVGPAVGVGPAAVGRFKPGDRIVTNSAGSVRNDPRFGAYQKYAVTTPELTAKIGEVSFEAAVSISNLAYSASALFMHLHLEKPGENPNPENKNKKVLIWGASSSFGAYAVYLAARAGYTVVGVASSHNAQLVKSFGAVHFFDRRSPTVTQELIDLGPFEAVLAAADDASDQPVLGAVLAAHGGGSFMSTMGLRPGVELLAGVQVYFAAIMNVYLDPKTRDFTEWVWWDYLERELASGRLPPVPVRVIGGLDQVQEAWNLLKDGKLRRSLLVAAHTFNARTYVGCASTVL